MKIKVILFVVFLMTNIGVYSQTTKSRGAIAYPYFQQFEQPDGTHIKLKMQGDGVLHWFVTEGGQKVLRDKEDWFTYAKKDANDYMVASSVRVGKSDIRYNGATINASKNMFFSNEQIKKRENAYFGEQEINSSFFRSPQLVDKSTNFPTIGKFKGLMILAEFPDKPHVISANKFHKIMNEVKYNGTGSFRDYYLENSYGKLDVTTDIVTNLDGSECIWVKLPHNMEFYGGNKTSEGGSDKNPQQMIIDAVKAADKFVDFSKYDNDNDSFVDNIMVIHSGYGEEGGAAKNTIWSHRYMLGSKAIELDGVKISDYITFPELSDHKDEHSTNIGVLVHEFGHALGLPDYYDTDAEAGGKGLGLGDWDVMDHGSWNAQGVTPAHHNAYSKHMLGWLDLPILNDETNPINGKVELVNQAEYNPNDKGKICAYVIKTTIPNDFYVLENRQQRLFDEKLPSHGMIVYHVDRTNNFPWTHNSVNNNLGHECMKLISARGVYNKSAQTISIPFPGSSRVTRLTDYTKPNIRAWGDYLTGSVITNIIEEDGVVSFDYMPHSKVDLTFKTQYKVQNKAINLAGSKIKFESISDQRQAPITVTMGEDNICVLKNFYLGIYKITVSGADRIINGKKIYFDTVYNDVEISSCDHIFDLKEAMKFKLSFTSYKQDKEVITVKTSIDYTGASISLIASNTTGKEPIKVDLDESGECILKDFIKGVYDVTVDIESKNIETEDSSKKSKKEEVFFTKLYKDFSFNLSEVILNLEKATVLNLIYTYKGVELKEIDFTGDLISLSSFENELLDINIRPNGSCLLGNIKNGFYDVQVNIPDKIVTIDGELLNLSFKQSYSKVLVKSPTSILKLKLKAIDRHNKLKLYPNPTRGEVQIQTSLKSGSIIRVFNMSGLLVLERILERSDLDFDELHSIDLSNLDAGIYNVLITDGTKKISKMIIKQ
ncbi:MAG: M6 family metalloprotease domain-containing protein [Marinifilaceae bacterium]